MAKVAWKHESDAHDYPAAASYLSLLLPDPTAVEALVSAFPEADPVFYKAKNLLRAARLPLLSANNPHVASDLRKIGKRKPLSQVLLVRGDLRQGLPLQIADGYHRVCASYLTDEDTEIACRVVGLSGAATGRPRSPTKRAPGAQASS